MRQKTEKQLHFARYWNNEIINSVECSTKGVFVSQKVGSRFAVRHFLLKLEW